LIYVYGFEYQIFSSIDEKMRRGKQFSTYLYNNIHQFSFFLFLILAKQVWFYLNTFNFS